MAYRLTPAAEKDLDAIYEEGFVRFGERAADKYSLRIIRSLELLGAQPRMAREREEYERPLRVHPIGPHVILYRLEGEDTLILRIRHGREDWQAEED